MTWRYAYACIPSQTVLGSQAKSSFMKLKMKLLNDVLMLYFFIIGVGGNENTSDEHQLKVLSFLIQASIGYTLQRVEYYFPITLIFWGLLWRSRVCLFLYMCIWLPRYWLARLVWLGLFGFTLVLFCLLYLGTVLALACLVVGVIALKIFPHRK